VPGPQRLTRRELVLGAAVAGLLLAVGCGSDETASSSSPGTQGPSAGAFPVEVVHKHGTTTIRSVPQRVVTVGFNDHDAVLALGVTPVGVRDWFGDQPYATWPWATEALGDAKPEVLSSSELRFERIAALRPDVIIGVYSGMTKQEYATLSKIAPTVADSADHPDYNTPWQEMTRTVGAVLGRAAEADELIAGVEERIAQARADHPEFEGASGVVIDGPLNGKYGILGETDPRGRLLEALGFEYPAAVNDAVPDDSFYGEVSAERLDILDTDVQVWLSYAPDTRRTVEGQPLYRKLRAAREERTVFLSELLTGAMGFSSVLSIPFLLGPLTSQLAAAVDGAPATAATAG